MISRLATITFALALATPAPSSADEPAVAADRILVLGDSLTKGYGVLEEEAFPAVLEKRLREEGFDWEVINGGVSGDTSAGGLRRIGWLLKRKPSILVLALGANDGLRGIDPASTEKNLQAIIDKARDAVPGIAVVVAGMTVPENLGADFVERFEAVFPKLAETNEAALIPFLLKGVAGNDELNQPDRIHPNAEGQRRIAETVWEKVAPLVAPDRPAAGGDSAGSGE